MHVKCPKCATVLKIADPEGPIKVKCPKCATVLQVGGKPQPAPAKKAPAKAKTPQQKPKPKPAPKAAAPPAQSPQPQQPVAPAAADPLGAAADPFGAAPSADPFGAAPSADPFGAPAAAAGDADPFGGGGIDFGNLPAGPAPGQQPVAQFQAAPAGYVPPPAQKKPAGSDTPDQPAPKKKKKKKKGLDKKTTGILFGVGVVLLVGAAAAVIFSGPLSSKASASRTAPEGFSVASANGVSIFMPDGTPLETFPSAMKCVANETAEGTVFFIGVTDSKFVDMEFDKLRQRVDPMMAAGLIGGSPCERNGYKGFKARSDQSIFLPDMDLEIFQDDGRVIVIGVSNPSSGDGTFVVGQVAEPELHKQFYDSLEIGPL